MRIMPETNYTSFAPLEFPNASSLFLVIFGASGEEKSLQSGKASDDVVVRAGFQTNRWQDVFDASGDIEKEVAFSSSRNEGDCD